MFIEYASALDFLIVVTASMSLYVGLCAYARGMVDDLRDQMQKINGRLLAAKPNRLRDSATAMVFVKAIRFHYIIIG